MREEVEKKENDSGIDEFSFFFRLSAPMKIFLNSPIVGIVVTISLLVERDWRKWRLRMERRECEC